MNRIKQIRWDCHSSILPFTARCLLSLHAESQHNRGQSSGPTFIQIAHHSRWIEKSIAAAIPKPSLPLFQYVEGHGGRNRSGKNLSKFDYGFICLLNLGLPEFMNFKKICLSQCADGHRTERFWSFQHVVINARSFAKWLCNSITALWLARSLNSFACFANGYVA